MDSKGSSDGAVLEATPCPRGRPIVGWLVGIGVGAWLSSIPCLWLHWATGNARSFFPVMRAAAAGDAALAGRRLREFDVAFVPDRLLERGDMKCAVRRLGLILAVESRDSDEIRAAITDCVRMVGCETSASWAYDRQFVTRADVLHPFETMSFHSLCIRAAYFIGDWDLAVGLADELLEPCPAFWSRIGGVPPRKQPDNAVDYAHEQARRMLREERFLRATRAMALARQGDLDRSRTELKALIAEPTTLQFADDYIRPELSFLLAAVESLGGDAAAAETWRNDGERVYASPPELQKRHGVFDDEYFYPGPRPATVAESWRNLRSLLLGFPPRNPGAPSGLSLSEWRWSVDDNARDFTDEYTGIEIPTPADEAPR